MSLSEWRTFGFPAGGEMRGWVGPADETIRPAMKGKARSVKEPFERTLAEWASRAWRQILPGNVWVMPASHWSFELTRWQSAMVAGIVAGCGG